MIKIIKTKKFKLTIFVATLLFGCTLFSACSQTTPEMSPMPALNMSKNTHEAALVSQEVPQSTEALSVQSPIELSDPVDELTNQGSNIENNGIAIESDGTIYFVQNGLNSISSNGNHRNTILEQTDMISLNIYKDYIYYVSSEDYTVYKIDKATANVPKSLYISGAYSMMIIQDYIYYQKAIGEEADNYIYRTDLDGLNPENLMIKASVFCTDGQNIYYANQESDNRIFALDTCTGEIEQLSNNQASQLNIIDGNLYYVNKTTKYITMLDVETLESTVLSEEACSYLNSNAEHLIFYFTDKNQLGTMSTDGSDINYILNYNDVNGLNVAGEWIFFESYKNTFEDEVFFLKTDGDQLSKELPATSMAKIVSYSAEDKTIFIDNVNYLTGEVAVEEYIHDNAVSERNAKEALEKTNGVYIQNINPKIIEYKLSDLTHILLNINPDSSNSIEGYNANITLFEEIYEKDPSLILDQLYNITGYEGQMIKIEQFYIPQ